MRRAFAIALVLAAITPAHFARAADEEEEEDSGDEEAGDEEAEASAPATGKDAAAEEEEEEEDSGLRPKQNLTGHDLGTNKRDNEFERDRFFVDKVDSEKTEEGTLIEGSIASSSFVYAERGGIYTVDKTGGGTMSGNNNGPTRVFTELRLQTDFRHIAASRWEARVDARVRGVNSIDPALNGAATPENNIQSGLTGENEYELRELWMIRAGKRTDFIVGRQFVNDLAAVKFDGLRFDYAKSAKLTFIGFGGLYPLRGSRSITTDYQPLRSESGNAAGRIVTVGGAGAAYRTVNAYGALGGVIMYPLKVEPPRFFVTSNGYVRSGSKLDVYHFALLDLLGTAASDSAAHVQLTNLSFGVNYKPDPRLRVTASAHQVDTETLSVQAGQFLNGEDTTPGGTNVVQNETYVARIATRMARAGVSAGLGKQQRFELSTALTFRTRPSFTLVTPNPMVADVPIPAASSVEIWGSIADRRSLFGLRLSLDGSRSFGVGDLAFQRSDLQLFRFAAMRDFADGRGEWEAEVSYTNVKDSVIGKSLNDAGNCGAMPVGPTTDAGNTPSCYGTSNNQLIAVGGQATYRFKPDWLGIATLHVLRIGNRRSDGVVDPTVTGITGFLRIAKRF